MSRLGGLLDDLAEESAALESVVAVLGRGAWRCQTPAPGWTIAHQIGHLAWTDELSILAATDPDGFTALVAASIDVDAAAATAAESTPEQLLSRWRRSRAGLTRALVDVPEGARIPWVGPAMGAASMATARLMETWAHGVDIRDTVGIALEPSPRLRAIAHLGVATRDFAFRRHGLTPPAGAFRVELAAPDGKWVWGPSEAQERVTGTALDFCLRVTQRRAPEQLGLTATGRHAHEWLRIAQAFAG